jgi:hypothetical protein
MLKNIQQNPIIAWLQIYHGFDHDPVQLYFMSYNFQKNFAEKFSKDLDVSSLRSCMLLNTQLDFSAIKSSGTHIINIITRVIFKVRTILL